MSGVPIQRRLEWIALRPNLSRTELEHLCGEAQRCGCLAVCVAGSRVELASSLLAESSVKVSALIGFPFGSSDSDAKRFEVEAAADAGAQEMDVVINHGWLKDGNHAAVLRELRDIREAAEERPVKAIIELGLLSLDEARRAGQIAVEAEIQFLVTASGCSPRATTLEEVRSLREAIGSDLGLKVVGGIHDLPTAEAALGAGANRLGVFELAPFVDAP
ncbi:MAG: deoxyribose-phosphate aldolase [Verrucomicrobiales bacterium]|nr:deoxyribose-phosphate aldolase [Verrucomicrobiales bacterium]